MPIIKSAIKRMRQTIKRRARNVTNKRDLRTAIKAFMTSPTAETLRVAQSEIDTAVKKNLLEKNTAARKKSQLVKIAKEAGVKVVAGAKKATAAAKPKAAAKPAAEKKTPAKKATAPAEKKPAAKKPAAKKPAAKKAAK